MRILAPTTRDIARFESKCSRNGECLTWTAAKAPKGYGMFCMSVGGTPRMVLAHRLAYTIAFGQIEDGMQIDHVCHEKSCVNPQHLRAVSNKQNSENHIGAARADSSSGVRGVMWDKRNSKWLAKVRHHGKGYHVGLFDNIVDADAAVTAKRLELFTHNNQDRLV